MLTLPFFPCLYFSSACKASICGFHSFIYVKTIVILGILNSSTPSNPKPSTSSLLVIIYFDLTLFISKTIRLIGLLSIQKHDIIYICAIHYIILLCIFLPGFTVRPRITFSSSLLNNNGQIGSHYLSLLLAPNKHPYTFA